MDTAQDAYKVMVRDHLSPRLRALGLKGSGGKYYWTSPSHWIKFESQKSMYSTWAQVRFTFNIFVYRGPRPMDGAPIAGTIVHSDRIGGFMPGGFSGRWLEVGRNDNVEAIADKTARIVRDYVLPIIQRSIEMEDGQ